MISKLFILTLLLGVSDVFATSCRNMLPSVVAIASNAFDTTIRISTSAQQDCESKERPSQTLFPCLRPPPTGKKTTYLNECETAYISYVSRSIETNAAVQVDLFVKLGLETRTPIKTAEPVNVTSKSLCCQTMPSCALFCHLNATSSLNADANYLSHPDSWDLRFNNSSGCIEAANSKETWRIFCSTSLASSTNLLFDKKRWIAFFTAQNGLHKFDLRTDDDHSVIPAEQFKSNPNSPAAVALNPAKEMIYWISQDSLKSSDYQCLNISSLYNFTAPIQTQNYLLTYFDDQLFWISSTEGDSSILKLNLISETSRVETITKIESEETILSYTIHPRIHQETLSNDCESAPCSHFCSLHSSSSSNYICWCPAELPLLKNGTICQLPKILLATSNSSDSSQITVDYAYPDHAQTDSELQIFPLVKTVDSTESFRFTTNSKIHTVCWFTGSQDSNPRCKTQDADDRLISSAKVFQENPLLFLDFEPAADILFHNGGSVGCLKATLLSNVNATLSIACLDTPLYPSYISPFGHGIALCTSDSSGTNVTLWRFFARTVSTTRVFSPDAGNCTAFVGDNFSRVYYIVGRIIATTTVYEAYSKKPSLVIWRLDYQNGRNLEYHDKHIFWLGYKPELGQFLEVLSVNQNKWGSKYRRLLATPPGLTFHSFKIYEPVKRGNEGVHPCRPSHNCSHFCFPKSPVLDSMKGPFRCACPDELVLDSDGFTCREPKSPEAIEKDIATQVAAVAVPFIIISALAAFIVYEIRKRRKITLLRSIIKELLQGNVEAAEAASDQFERAANLPFNALLPQESITVLREKVLGEGNFGVVYEGKYDNQAVAVKAMKYGTDEKIISEFISELKMMAYIGNHANIVKFIGAETTQVQRGRILVALELSPYGSLESYLQSHRKHFRVHQIVDTPSPKHPDGPPLIPPPPHSLTGTNNDQTEPLSLPLLFSWAEQIANGMSYLEERRIFHGDLATRNLLLFQNHVVKISDFGFSRNLYNYASYVKGKKNSPLPWRWAAIETLEQFEFSVKSDVWAYGVTLWEIFTLGNCPYPQHRWTTDFVEAIRNGMRLSSSDLVYAPVYENVMLPCWDLVRENRPSFIHLRKYFHSLQND